MAEKQQEYIWDAKFIGSVVEGTETKPVEIVQLVSAKTLRRALVKSEKYQEREGLTTAHLVSIVQRNDVVV